MAKSTTAKTPAWELRVMQIIAMAQAEHPQAWLTPALHAVAKEQMSGLVIAMLRDSAENHKKD